MTENSYTCRRHGLLKEGEYFLYNVKEGNSIRNRWRCKLCNKIQSISQKLRYKEKGVNLYEKYKETSRKASIKYYHLNKNKHNAATKAWKMRNEEKAQEYQKKSGQNKKENLTDSYIKSNLSGKLGVPFSEIPQELVELKRQHIKLKRLLNIKQENKK